MATLVLSAAGAAVGGSFAGSIAGLTSLAVGKAVGATLGSAIDQRLLGLGSAPVETGRVDRFRIMGSTEGSPLPRIYGRMRVPGQIIWSSRFLETVRSESVGGKGAAGQQSVREFSYSISMAIALCEGEVVRVGRIWADGQALDQSTISWRLHKGSEHQLPDPVISAIEGAEFAPAYRGTAYIVFENLDLTPFGNRIPQFNFEVFRRAKPMPGLPNHPAIDVRGVALMPGTGEYSLATEPVYFLCGKGSSQVLNVHNDEGLPDLKASLGHLESELPNAESVSLIVTWFGNDLRCGRCKLQPAVEQSSQDGDPMPWRVSGTSRSDARVVSRIESRPVFGGTPTDSSVLQAIKHLRSTGRTVMFYPFILMDILAGNGLENPWSDAGDQPAVPWRGRITVSKAPGLDGTPDKTPAAALEVGAFFGEAKASDFVIDGDTVMYVGAPEWSYRRFVLHYAHLCALAGGVEAFCIGSEMRSLLQVRDGPDTFPAVEAMRALVDDVRAIVGPNVKIGYAADWSEYFGYRPTDGSNDVFFHLDPLWSHPTIDFIGIDNYMPLSDWREGILHADAGAGSIYNLDYLSANVAGGEGFDWYYADETGRRAQARLAIMDGAYGEDWIFRYKDLAGWWSNVHVNRIGGAKVGAKTDWTPRSKPIWFTELGCPAVDKGTNQPNVFVDPKSSESFVPYFSSGARDDFIQYRYLQATFKYWSSAANNPASDVYAGRMVDMARAHVWAWDARPWPDFPNRLETWSDGGNYVLGHWLNGRTSLVALADIVSEVCVRADTSEIDVTGLFGAVSGYSINSVETSRQSLQPLMVAFGFDSFSDGGNLWFANRTGHVVARRKRDQLVAHGQDPVIELSRGPSAETAKHVTLGFIRADHDYQSGAAEAMTPDAGEQQSSRLSFPIVLSENEAQAIADRWVSEGRIAADTVTFSLPPSDLNVTSGDVIRLEPDGAEQVYRIDRVDELGHRLIKAVRVEPGVYEAPRYAERGARAKRILATAPVYAEFLDLPILKSEDDAHSPRLAVGQAPWAGPVAAYSASADHGYRFDREFNRPAVFGETLEVLPWAFPGVWANRSLRLRIESGVLQSKTEVEVFNGANVSALRNGREGDWEVFQFATATRTGSHEYLLSGLLRGQAGTDVAMPEAWPQGTDFVLLDGAIKQLNLPLSARGLERHYRIGPAKRGYDDPSYLHRVETFYGIGLRPYKPVHLNAVRASDGSIVLRWIRRTRIDGDNWSDYEVPLGEERERYQIVVSVRGTVVRDLTVAEQQLIYSLVDQRADDIGNDVTFEVAQVSAIYGPGPYGRIDFDG